MAVWSKVSTSDLVGAVRLDAEFWQPTYLEKEKIIRANKSISLGNLVSRFKKGIFYILAREYSDQGVPFFRSSNVGAILPNETNLTYITDAKHRDEYKTSLEPGDLMIVKTGHSGASVVFSPSCNVSQDVIATRVYRDRINPYYLAVYLNTRFGFSEMNRWFQGQVQPHLSLNDARRILVALVSDNTQLEIERIVKLAFQKRLEAEVAHRIAYEQFAEALGLDTLNLKKSVGYTTQFSELQSSFRNDAEHFNPNFKAFQSNLPAGVKLFALSRYLRFCRRGKQPVYKDSGLPVINSKHVKTNRITLVGNRYGDPNPDPSLQIQFGDVLMNGTGRGTLGRVAPYLFSEPAIPDNHVTILRSDILDPVYVSFYLNSLAGQMQVEMHQRGTSGQLELYPFDIRKFLIWPAPDDFQREIRNLYEKALAAEHESARLLEQAKAQVERLIEEAVQA